MPYLALADEQQVLPPQITSADALFCPQCDDQMSLIPAHYSGGTFVSAHFRHEVRSDCPGESPEHGRMKSVAFSKLEEAYPEAEILFEAVLKDGNEIHRQADVLVEFPEPRHPFGKGIAVEVQYRNYSKDLRATEQDYYQLGYSVLWLYEQHYSDSGNDVDIRHVRTVWPNAVPHDDRSRSTLSDFLDSDDQESIEVDVRFPDAFIRSIESELRDAFETGESKSGSSSNGSDGLSFDDLSKVRTTFDPYHKAWLSGHTTKVKKSLELVTGGRTKYALQLSKGEKGSSPETVKIPVTPANVEELSVIGETIASVDSAFQTNGEWDTLLVHQIKDSDSGIVGNITLSSPDDNIGVVLQIQRVYSHGHKKELGAKFVPDRKTVRGLSKFFKDMRNTVAES